MCYRFFLRKSDLERAKEALRAALRAEFGDRFNIAPNTAVAAIRGDAGAGGSREAVALRWGLVPAWAGKPGGGALLANARADTLAQKPAFRSAFKRRRCVVPASGYFEWENLPGLRKQPWLFRRADGDPLLLAGLWETWHGPDGSVLESCAIVTTEPNDLARPIHDRMPVSLDRIGADRWLDTPEDRLADLRPLLAPPPEGALERFRVDPRVNSVRVDDEACVRPLAGPPPPAADQLSLGLD